MMPWARGSHRKCSTEGDYTREIEKYSPFLKKIIITLFSSVHSCFCCDTYSATERTAQGYEKKHFSIPKNPGSLSCCFGPAIPDLFQTVLSPFYSFNGLTRRASTFQMLPLEKGISWLQLAARCSVAGRSVTQWELRHSQRHQPHWKRETSVRFPLHVTGSCSESMHLTGVRPAYKTARYYFPC